MDIKEAYRVMQEASGIGVGDKVRVLRVANMGEMGWMNSWARDMDETIGHEGVVEAVGSDVRVNIKTRVSEIRCYPFFVLEVIEKAQAIELRYFCDGKDVTDKISTETKNNLKKS